LSDVKGLAEKIHKNKLAFAVTGMVTDVLTFFRQNPGAAPDPDLITFLSSGLSSLKALLEPKSGEARDPEETFSIINEQFSVVSSKLTLDIPKIEIDLPLNEYDPGKGIIGPDEGNIQVESGAGQEGIRTSGEKSDQLVDLPPKRAEKSYDVVSLDTTLIASDLPAKSKTMPLSDEGKASLPPAESRKADAGPFSYYKNMLKEISSTVNSMEKESFLIQGTLGITEDLTVKIKSLATLTNRFMAVVSTGIPPNKDLKHLQDAVSAISADFETFLQIAGKKDDIAYKVEEITPVVVGRRMIGVLSEAIVHLYSITPQQEKKFREAGYVGLNGAQVPFIDLMEKFSETPASTNKRLIITYTSGAKKALLVDKVLKKRFVFTNASSSVEGPIRTGRFFMTEEIMIYKLD